jgi:hypothetical protein
MSITREASSRYATTAPMKRVIGAVREGGMLQLIPGLVTRLVPVLTVNTWRRKPHFEVRNCGPVKFGWAQTMQDHAIATACLAEMMSRGPLPWQSKQDG